MNRAPVTDRSDFCSMTDGKALFSVSPGVPLTDALVRASDLMECVTKLSLTVATDAGSGGEAFAVYYLAEMAKALIDASMDGLVFEGGRQ